MGHKLIPSGHRIGRGAIAIALSYVLVIQSLLFGIVASGLAAEAPGFELCLSGADHAPPAPDAPAKFHIAHCLFCFAGQDSNLAVPAQSVVLHDGIGRDGVRLAAVDRYLPDIAPYSIARPRGPPLSA